MSNSPHVSNNICVSLATIELSGTITYIKIWDIACEAVGAKGTSIVLQVRRFMFSFWMTTSKSLPPFLPPFCLFRPTVCSLHCSLSNRAAPRGHPTRFANLNTDLPVESKTQHGRQRQSITASHGLRANSPGCSKNTKYLYHP